MQKTANNLTPYQENLQLNQCMRFNSLKLTFCLIFSAAATCTDSYSLKASEKKLVNKGEGGSQLRFGAPSGVMQSRSLSLSHFLTSQFTTSTQRIGPHEAAAAAAAAALPSGVFFSSSSTITNNLDSPRAWEQLLDFICHTMSHFRTTGGSRLMAMAREIWGVREVLKWTKGRKKITLISLQRGLGEADRWTSWTHRGILRSESHWLGLISDYRVCKGSRFL